MPLHGRTAAAVGILAISGGICGYLLRSAALIATGGVRRVLAGRWEETCERTVFCCFDPDEAAVYERVPTEQVGDEALMPLPEDNADSWRQLRVLIEEYSADARNVPWQVMARHIISELEMIGLGPLFRAGMAMNHVVFSTSGHHGLRDEPRVMLEFRPEQQEVRIAYAKADIDLQPPMLDAYVSAPVAVQVTMGALRRLWTESKPDVPMPQELGERKPPASA